MAQNKNKSALKPYIPASKIVSEITLKSILLSLILTVLMGGANAYLGLKIGMTVAATIPAAVISMSVLKFFKEYSILENNIVQTSASAGEAVASAVVFSIPALLIMKYWNGVDFYITSFIIAIGGILGVLFSIPLRRALIIESELKFPEGVATAEVLKIGDKAKKGGAKYLIIGSIFSGIAKICQSGFIITDESLGYWTKKGKTVMGAEMGFSFVLVGAGYIVGVSVGLAVLFGGISAWLIGVPLYTFLCGSPEGMSAYDAAIFIWDSKIRIVGIGAIVVGGLWSVIHIFEPIKTALKQSLNMINNLRLKQQKIIRTDHDIPFQYVLIGIVLILFPLAYLLHHILDSANLEISSTLHWISITVMVVFVVLFGFLSSAISGYMAGLVGSSNSPLSGVMLLGLIFSVLLLAVCLGQEINFQQDSLKVLSVSGIVIVMVAIMGNASVASADNLQDLKAGQIVGATPWKQQMMLIFGVVVSAVIMAPILDMLYNAYGIGDVFPRAGMDPSAALAAPKAKIMADLSRTILLGTMDWTMFTIGIVFAISLIIVEKVLQKSFNKEITTPILPIAVGIYLPLFIVFPVFIGGLVSYLAKRNLKVKNKKAKPQSATKTDQQGVLFASGLIAGEAIVGILLAIPFSLCKSTKIFSIRPNNFDTSASVIGLTAFLFSVYYLYTVATKAKE